MRCSYCIFSGEHDNYRTRASRTMTPETGRAAIDWFARHIEPQSRRTPGRRMGITIYGGEPLCASRTLRSILAHAEHKYPGAFDFIMTTNGTLLKPSIVRTLEHHNVSAFVSIDGPQEEHDRRRPDAMGRGTHGRIVENLARIKRDHPAYWRAHLYSIPVYDWRTDLDAAAAFFEDERDIVPPPLFVFPVEGQFSTYYQRFSLADRVTHEQAILRLTSAYKRAVITGEPVGRYLSALFATRFMSVQYRRRGLDGASLPWERLNGACLPGSKVSVQVDGTITLCERVNQSLVIGDIAREGLDLTRICQLLAEYSRLVAVRCRSCPIANLCGRCYKDFQGYGHLASREDACLSTIEWTKRSLQDYISICEAKPTGPFQGPHAAMYRALVAERTSA